MLKNLRKSLKLSLGILFFARYGFAVESLWHHQFQNTTGSTSSLSQLNSNETRASLVMFWASWCLPCKEELSALVNEHWDLGPTRLIAITVDDASGQVAADVFLAGIHWQNLNWRDLSGEFFYAFNPGGQMPMSILLDKNGGIVKTYAKLNA